MTIKNLTQATVRRGLLEGKTPPDSLAALDNVCAAGAQCPEVQGSPLAMQAFAALQQATAAAHGTMANKQSLAQALMAAMKALRLDISVAKDALAAYQAAVVIVAQGNAMVINKAGLNARTHQTSSAAVEGVTDVTGAPGKQQREGIVRWPAVVGATGYAVEVNDTPERPDGPWSALIPGRGRRRVVKAPAPGAQLLVRVAALGKGNTQSAWSDPTSSSLRVERRFTGTTRAPLSSAARPGPASGPRIDPASQQQRGGYSSYSRSARLDGLNSYSGG